MIDVIHVFFFPFLFPSAALHYLIIILFVKSFTFIKKLQFLWFWLLHVGILWSDDIWLIVQPYHLFLKFKSLLKCINQWYRKLFNANLCIQLCHAGPPHSLLTSETTCSGGALVNHSYQDPSYTAAPGAPHRWAASTMWQAVTPEPQDPQSGLFRSTFEFSKNFFSCSVESIMPSSSTNPKKGMHLEPGMWPGLTPVGQ